MKRVCTWTTAVAFSLLGLAVVSTLRAEDPVVYTRVAQWQIARTNWDAYEKDLKLLAGTGAACQSNAGSRAPKPDRQ